MSFALVMITLLCVTGIAIGQLLFKQAASALPPQPTWQDWVFNGWLIAALALYGVTTLVWVWILRHAPLHLAYPFMGLAFIIVPVLAYAFLGEPLSIKTLLGGALIIAGVSLAANSL
ncbi:MAG: EamA family transporter [Gammaproteobacteria bacterium]|nr:EamA family transporter [Gammaproteobacteria bacterium]